VCGQIAIAGLKPRRLSHLCHGIQTKESVALHAPAALLAQFACQHVRNRIDIRRNVPIPTSANSSPVFTTIVSSSAGNNVPESIHKLSATCSPGQEPCQAAARFHIERKPLLASIALVRSESLCQRSLWAAASMFSADIQVDRASRWTIRILIVRFARSPRFSCAWYT